VQPVEEHAIDGVKIVFQLAPETEAPAEMHMFYPELGVLNMAENACPAAAQLHPAARRGGARSAHLGQVHRRRHRDVFGRAPRC
jgi:alkyl sulfatase BDS1-like metallo-beta-lactamase superfamily hydrolase